MLEHLKSEFNKTQTDNGAFAYKSTKSKVLDLFSQGGAYRSRSDRDIISLFSEAFSEDKLLSMRTLFHIRNVRGGMGERRFFRIVLDYLSKVDEEVLRKNLHLIPKFGRWDDLWLLLDTDLKDDVVDLVDKQLREDMNFDTVSLLAKWMPSLKSRNENTRRYAYILRTSLKMSPRKYRKLLSHLRSKIGIVETHITDGEFNKIEYDKIPSRAGMIYRNAFFRNDEKRYRAFLNSLEKGEVKVNAGTLYPNDIVGKILGNAWWHTPKHSTQDIKLFEGQWNSLPDFIGENKENSMVMADVSASMTGTPMNVAISLAMYIAERNKGSFHNHFMTFSSRPELVEISGDNIVDKVNNIKDSNWGHSTNIESALMTILNVGISNNVPSENMISKLYIISDMQFDMCSSGADKHIFETVRQYYEDAGYNMPQIVFWNVNARTTNTPFTMNDDGVALVSGYSPSILTHLLGDKHYNPYEIMLSVVNSDMYRDVVV